MNLQVYKTDRGYVAVSDVIQEQPEVASQWNFYDLEHGTIGCSYNRKSTWRELIATDTSFSLDGVAQFPLEHDLNLIVDHLLFSRGEPSLRLKNSVYDEEKALAKDTANKYKEHFTFTEQEMFEAMVWALDNSVSKYGGKPLLKVDLVTSYLESIRNKTLVGIEVEIDDSGVGEYISFKSPTFPDGLLNVTNYKYSKTV